jgi:hypothetical protein
MNLANVYIKKVLTEDERNNIRDALSKDEVIIPTLLKILAGRINECRPSQGMLKDACYPYLRASKDGAQVELEWLVDILTQTKE